MLLRKRAEELIDLMEKTKAELTSPQEGIAGDIHIGCGETEGISFLAKTAQDLQEKYPMVHFHIYSGPGCWSRKSWTRGSLTLAC